MAYTKLFSSIVTSTIWREPSATRIVWVTLLALADKNGEVQGSIPGLAHLSGVSVDECEKAIEKLMSPDTYSRTQVADGRRLEKIDGGWELINHGKYRALASKDDAIQNATERKRRSRARLSQKNVTVTDVTTCHAHVTQDRDIAEAEAEASQIQNTEIQNTPLPPKGGAKGPLQLRAEAIFHRRIDTPLDRAEKKAFREAKKAIEETSEEEWLALERFYSLPQPETCSRKSLATLVNNWNGEIERAKAWKSEPTQRPLYFVAQ